MSSPLPIPQHAYMQAKRGYVWLLAAFACLPIIYVIMHVIAGSRNVPYWDEYDSALDFVLGINRKTSFFEKVTWFFSMSNEHRMLTSRSLFAVEYWLTGGINFHFIGFIGNVFLFITCALLVWSVRTVERRLSLFVLLAFIVFQLQNYENFLWSGSSIDHYQVVLLAAVTFAFLLKNTTTCFYWAGFFGVLANYTLAHGIVVWLVGAILLVLDRRWRQLGVWVIICAVAVGGFFWGFHSNPGHHIVSFSYSGIVTVALYWLKLLGAPLALGGGWGALVMGVLFLSLASWLLFQNRWKNARLVGAMIAFVVISLLVVAVGRAGLYNATNLVPSRYLILGSVGWTLVAYGMLERWSSPLKPLRLVVWCLPVLIAYNIVANQAYLDRAFSFLESRDLAVLRYRQHGRDGAGISPLHPAKGRAEKVLREAKDKDVYAMPVVCKQRNVGNVRPNPKIAYYLDNLEVSSRAIFVRGWAGLPRFKTERGAIQLVLKSEKDFLVFSTVPMFRPDVARECKQPKWRYSGFAFAASNTRIPAGDYEIGLLLNIRGNDEYVMTGKRVSLNAEVSNVGVLANNITPGANLAQQKTLSTR